MFRELYGGLHAAASAETEPHRFAAALELLEPPGDAALESLTLQATAVMMASSARRMLEDLERYDAALAKLPGG